MAYGLGISFQPGTGGNGGDPNDPNRPRVAPVQEAVRLLSLRLPTVVGARALAPQEILAQGGGAPSVMAERLGVPTSQTLLAPSAAPGLAAESKRKRDLMDLVFNLYSGGGGRQPNSAQTLSVSGGAPSQGYRARGNFGVSITAGVRPPSGDTAAPGSPSGSPPVSTPLPRPPVSPPPPIATPPGPETDSPGPRIDYDPPGIPEPEVVSPWLDRMTSKYEDEYQRG